MLGLRGDGLDFKCEPCACVQCASGGAGTCACPPTARSLDGVGDDAKSDTPLESAAPFVVEATVGAPHTADKVLELPSKITSGELRERGRTECPDALAEGTVAGGALPLPDLRAG